MTTTFVYDGAQFLESRTSTATTRYVYDLGIDRPMAHVVSSTATYYIADHLGSIVATTDAAGDVTLARDYDAWGNLLSGASTGGYAFTGREWEPEAGLYYYRARHYDPGTGRFVSQDPLGFGGGMNVYAYAGENPVRFSDPWGLAAMDPTPAPPNHYNACYQTCLYTSRNEYGEVDTDRFNECLYDRCQPPVDLLPMPLPPAGGPPGRPTITNFLKHCVDWVWQRARGRGPSPGPSPSPSPSPQPPSPSPSPQE